MAVSENDKRYLQYIIADGVRHKLQMLGLHCTEVDAVLDWHNWQIHLLEGHPTSAFVFEVRRTGARNPPYRFIFKCAGKHCTLLIPGVYLATFEYVDPLFPDNLIDELIGLLTPGSRWQRLWCRLVHDHEYVGFADFQFDRHLYVCQRCLQFFNRGTMRIGKRWLKVNPTSL